MKTIKIIRNVLIFLGAVFFSAASIVLCTTETGTGSPHAAVTYAVYVLAAVFLGAFVRLSISFFRQGSPKKRLGAAARRTRLTARIYDDCTFRTVAAGHLSLAIGSFFALTKAAAGWFYASPWLCALALYYLSLCIIKALILHGVRRIPKETAGAGRMRLEWKLFRLCGVFLLLITMTLQGIIILIVEQEQTFSYPGTLIFAVALYDFYCLISSCVYMVRMRKRHTPAVVSLKTVSFAASLAAMLALQTAMFASFGNEMEKSWQQLMNIMTGTAVCVILMIWGVLMVRRAQKELKKESGRNDDDTNFSRGR